VREKREFLLANGMISLFLAYPQIPYAASVAGQQVLTFEGCLDSIAESLALSVCKLFRLRQSSISPTNVFIAVYGNAAKAAPELCHVPAHLSRRLKK
jgi:hypothetical protein